MGRRTFDEQIARIAVGGYDDAQELRKAQMNRVRDIVRKKNEGIPFDKKEEKKDEQNFDEKYADENLPELIDEMLDDGKLTQDEHEYLEKMLAAGELAEHLENQYQDVFDITENEPIYNQWLAHVYGVSSTLTARLIHHFGYCEEFSKPTNLWSYCGLAPGQKKRKGEQADFSTQAKNTAWLVADCMVKCGGKSYYRSEFYEPYKEKQLQRLERDKNDKCIKCGQEPQIPDEEYGSEDDKIYVGARCKNQIESNGEFLPSAPSSEGHAHNRAMRYLMKKFLKHYWAIARDIKGMNVPDDYMVTHGGHDKQEETFENPFYAKKEVAARR